MSEAPPDEWAQVVETLRRDLEIVADDADDEDVSAAVEEVWAIVDAFDERVGDVDVDRIARVLGADADSADGTLDASSIPDALVADDPGRAAILSRLVSTIELDAATDYDVGRLWDDGRDVEVDADDRSTGAEDAGSTAAEGSAGSASADESPGDDSTDGSSASSADEDTAEKLRSALGDSLSEFRGRIEEARQGLVESSESGDGSPEEGSTDDGHRSTGSSTPGSSRSSDRSTTAVSTIPSRRADMGGVTHLSTVPGRGGRSRSSKSASTNDGDDERNDSDDEA